MPAYKAGRTLAPTYRDLPHDVMVFEIIEALAAQAVPRQPVTPGAEQSPSSGEPI